MEALNLIDCISVPRLRFYKDYLKCATDDDAIGAYIAYQELSGDFFCLIQMIEVALRNAIHSTLKEGGHGSSWFDSIPFSSVSKELVTNAKDAADKECGARYEDDDVICRLTMGFWVYMLDSPYSDTTKSSYIWTPENKNRVFGRFKGGFDNKKGKPKSIRTLFDDFQRLLKFRNRLFHHEPVWKKSGCDSHEKAVDNMMKEFDFYLDMLKNLSPEKAKVMELLGYEKRFKDRCKVERVQMVIKSLKDET